jgi:hypothetical protein
MRRIQDRIVDLQHDGFAIEAILVIEDFSDQVDLFPMLDLVHQPTLARISGIDRRIHHASVRPDLDDLPVLEPQDKQIVVRSGLRRSLVVAFDHGA